MGVRGDLQSVNLKELSAMLKTSNVFFEGNPYTAEILTTHPLLQETPKLSVFLSPLSKDEISYFADPNRNVKLPDLVTEIMRRKQLRRKTHQKIEISMRDLEDIETRSSSAYRELKMAWQFDYVIPNHDGEDSDNWELFYYPIGDARKTMRDFIALLEGKKAPGVEKWEKDLLK
jgi:guanylate kinase